MKFNAILLDIAEGVATITLNRPDKLNSFTGEMHADLKQAMQIIMADAGVRVLMITGAGRGFCAGQDLSERMMGEGKETTDVGNSLEKNYNPLLKQLRALPYPVVCAVNGVAAGAGCNLVLACDIVIAAKSASFIQVFSRIALVPDLGSTWLLPRLVGRQRALELMLTNEPLSADLAKEWGLVREVFDDAALRDGALALARRLASGPTRALVATRRLIDESEHSTYADQFRREIETQAQIRLSADAVEGRNAFLEKRPARFSGR